MKQALLPIIPFSKLKKPSAFTLVELIVVITILAILGTIGFISFLGYQTIARDSMRNADMALIERTLEYYKLQSGFYPDPQDTFEISYSGSLAWRQGVYGEETRIITGRLSSVPIDPSINVNYTYSTTYNRQEFQLASVLEGGLFAYQDGGAMHRYQLTPQAHAQNYRARVIGNYNGRIIALNIPGRIIILGVPSIISSEIESIDIQDIFSRGSLVLNNQSNLPSSYHNTSDTIIDTFQAPSFTPGTITGTPPVLYDDTLENFNTTQGQEGFGANIITYYSESNIANNFSELNTTLVSNPLNVVANYIEGNVGGMNSQILIAHGGSNSSSTNTPPSQVILAESDLKFLVVEHAGPNPPGVRWVRLRTTPNGPYPVDYGKICSYKIDNVVDFTDYVAVWEGIPTTRVSGEFPEIIGILEGVARPNWWASDVFGIYTPVPDYGVVVAYSTSTTQPILTELECNRL